MSRRPFGLCGGLASARRQFLDQRPGNSATNNAVGGLAAFAIAGALLALAQVGAHPRAALAAGSLGVVGMTVFHARRGAYRLSVHFGKPLPKI